MNDMNSDTVDTAIGNADLDKLMPMHLIVSTTGHLVRVGPTLKKIFPGEKEMGTRLLELFEIRRPRNVTSMLGLKAAAGQKLHLQLRVAPFTTMKGIVAELPSQRGYLLNLSFGISIVDAVREFDLTGADFSPTELAVEMLYLVEAKSAVMNESRSLNLRLQGARIAAEEQAFTDTLTGLKNRRALQHVLGRLESLNSNFALMQVDLDYFKKVNDALGHAAGDQVLQHVASVLAEETRSQDTVARVGGDEFVLIFHRLVDEKKLTSIGERIIKRLEEPVMHNGEPCQISGSIGLAISSSYRAVDTEAMLVDADSALYRSKAEGRGRVSVSK